MIRLRQRLWRTGPQGHGGSSGQAIGDAVRAARTRLIAAGIAEDEAAMDAAGLAMHALGWDRATLLTRDRDPVPPQFPERFEPLVRRREAREPMAYVRGWQEFWGREFVVSPGVLIPRPETELLVEEAIAWRHARSPDEPPPRVVDIGTGSGCLAVTLACEWPDAEIAATDISEAALTIARGNARRWNVETRVRFHLGPYLAEIEPPIDLIVANPPYVADADRALLPPEVRDYEPGTALFGGDDGLRDARAILHAAADVLSDDGRLLMEIGAGQADTLRKAVSGTPRLSLVEIRADLQGIPRAAVIRLTDWESRAAVPAG